MSDSSNICLSCGVCCDGTLIGFVELSNEELPVLRDTMAIEEANGKGFFLQPCKSYCNGCTIYTKRPKQCANFNCKIIKSLEQKELDFNTALEIIDVVKQKRVAIEKKLAALPFELQSQSFYFKMVEVKNLLLTYQPESALMPTHLELLSDLNQLDGQLTTRFGVSLY